MIDMLVRLYDLPDCGELYESLQREGVIIRRARAFEKHQVASWAVEHFSPKWGSECEVALSREPVSCFIATRNKEIIGFVCYGATMKGFLGPMGVTEGARGLGLGKALLVRGLEAMYAEGYAYAVIGGVGPREFYEKAVGAIEIPGSDPGIYGDILPEK
ncbi:GNAT family N-acetyltransferase [Sulfuriroseicoccus oceanibius]|uniref:GNAT family N-acetyltransferase n=1 Tax=Sulfuriroseicoccus oceanibius TaxID=2707525 RepID=A0A6B3L782_9BACT|nr:GNAT family N-acetyltransferase [Sulfuriroseicoccus oceanibius]QQL45132.1 GNAT family N-acetyltransferase [Sulfuriroseicoccus oceanibius]